MPAPQRTKFLSQARAAIVLMATMTLLPACDGGGESGDGGSTSGDSRVDMILSLSPDAAAGAQVFTNTCGASICHGADGNSGSAADLSTVAPSLSDAQLVTTVLDGVGNMPPMNLSDQEVADVVAYLNENFM
jgi:mono/diheme cytochrome c family protein